MSQDSAVKSKDADLIEWEKELRVLLQLIQDRPSQDFTQERDRIAVLNKLIAGRARAAAG